MSITGTIVNGQIQLPAGIQLPEGMQVEVVIESPAPRRTFAERYAKYIGVVKDVPADLAAEHDHY